MLWVLFFFLRPFAFWRFFFYGKVRYRIRLNDNLKIVYYHTVEWMRTLTRHTADIAIFKDVW